MPGFVTEVDDMPEVLISNDASALQLHRRVAGDIFERRSVRLGSQKKDGVFVVLRQNDVICVGAAGAEQEGKCDEFLDNGWSVEHCETVRVGRLHGGKQDD